MKIIILAYLSEKWSGYDKSLYPESDSVCDNSDLTKIQMVKFKVADGRHIEKNTIFDDNSIAVC